MKIPSKWNLPEGIKNRFGLQTAGKQRAMSCDKHLLLILHKAPVEDVNERLAVIYWRDPKGKWLDSSGNQGIYHLQNHLLEYSQLADSLDNYYEQATSSTDYFKLQEELTPLHRAAKNFCEAVQAASDEVKEDREIIDLRDQSQ
ncbi:MAG: hypothetical protein HRT88_17425, partial [Lentisphaeraceae bacterium]|nr:hypothetical protein [Lentisphaeraceae bacterium]